MIGGKLTSRALAEITGIVFSALSMIYISRVVGPEYLGFSATTSAILLLLSRLADGGMTSLASQRLARDDDTLSFLLAITIPPKIVVSIILITVTLMTTLALHLDQRLTYFMVVSVALIFFEACTPAWVFVALGRIGIVSTIRVGQSMLYAASLIAFIHEPEDWKYLPFLMLFNSIINFSMATLFLRYFKLYTFERAVFRDCYLGKVNDFYREARHFLKADLSAYVYTTSDRLILYYFTNAYTVGIYEAAYKVINPFYSINTVITPTMFRDLARSFKQGRFYPVMAKYVFTMSLFTIPLGFFLMYFSRDVVSLLYGSKFAESSNCLMILGFVITFGFTSGIIVQPFSAWNMSREYGSSVFWGNILNTLCNVAMIPFMGAMGAALATLVAKLIVTVVGYAYFRKATDYPIVKDISYFFIASIIPLIAVFLLSTVVKNSYVLIGSYGAVYLLIIYFMYQYYFKSGLKKLIVDNV